MKTILTTLFLLQLAFVSSGQSIVQFEYCLDLDAGVGKNAVINVNPTVDDPFDVTINLSGVPAGYHQLYTRTKDSDGIWSFTSRRTIQVVADDIKHIVTGEYFFDDDPGAGSGIPFSISSPDSTILQNVIAFTSRLVPGYHKLYSRLKDTHGNWSHTSRRTIEAVKSPDTNYINALEYFLAVDPGVGRGNPVSVTTSIQDGEISFLVPLDKIKPGIDTLYVRVRDSSETSWSLTKWIPVHGIVPLTLLSFSVGKIDYTAHLHWKTTNEVNTAYFGIERSIDGIHFTAVGKLAAKSGYTGENDYFYSDNLEKEKASKFYYRLLQVDTDGSSSYSQVAVITMTNPDMRFKISPNPATNFITINAAGRAAEKDLTIIVTDLAGHTLLKQKFSNTGSLEIPVLGLAKGIYIINIITNTQVQTQKLFVE